MKYADDPRFRGYYFEDSYVLSVNVGISQTVFELDAVLTPEHPYYNQPKPGETYCHKRVHLWFKNAFDVQYEPSGVWASWDADDNWDYGNIDIFEIEPPHGYRLSGEWGELKLKAIDAFVKDIGS